MRFSMSVLLAAILVLLSGCGAGKSGGSDKPAADAKAKPADAPAATAPDTGDAELTKKLMADGGRWSEPTDDGEVIAVFLPEKIVNLFVGDTKISGSWEIKGGNLIMSIKDEKSVDKIKEITAKEFIYVDGDSQKTIVATKVKD